MPAGNFQSTTQGKHAAFNSELACTQTATGGRLLLLFVTNKKIVPACEKRGGGPGSRDHLPKSSPVT
jgi:hypothetical protein